MKRLAKVALAIVVLFVLGVGLLLMTVPLNVPWRSMLQQMRGLPAWLDLPPMSSEEASRLVVPDGYAVSLFATGVPEARGLRVTERGDVVVTSPRDGRVMLLEADRDGDGLTDGRRVLVEGLDGPNGIDLVAGFLYVGEEDGVGRVGFDDVTGAVTGSYRRIIEGLPQGGNHWKKTIRVGPDGLLYVAVGSSCNACIEEDARRAALLRFTTGGTFVDTYATGLRNSGGFDWSPVSGALFATDNGRDLLGDDFPPCELNEVVEGGFYGWPFLNGTNVPDPDLGAEQPAALGEAVVPVHAFQAHNAPLGIQFLRHDRHPAGYHHAAVVALHGSWNRTAKDGYKVVSLHFAADGTIEERDFLTGLLQDDVAIGRPADVAEGPDGSVYVSDDFAGAVYRIFPGKLGDEVVAVPRAGGIAYDPSVVDPEAREEALAAGAATMVAEGCVACHAATDADESGQVVLTDLAADYSLEELVDYLARPNPPMPPYDEDTAARLQLAIYLLETY